jgi:hypothetical protein
MSRAEAEWTELNETQGQVETESVRAQEEIRILNQQLSEMSLDEAQEQVSYWTTRAAVIGQSLNDARARRDERTIALKRIEEQQHSL